ncbi:MAG: hypothetical protein HW405_907, partial [Candidatus Berkelbacteria bacterium]|nr:hypothetical protein [Candidatus Berkelbacteria bacterium]
IKKGVYPNNGLSIVREAGISVREIEYN